VVTALVQVNVPPHAWWAKPQVTVPGASSGAVQASGPQPPIRAMTDGHCAADDKMRGADDYVEKAACSRRTGQLAAFRDATLFKVVYGWGLRRREAAMLDMADFTPSPAAPELGGLGVSWQWLSAASWART
jgi:hypothetical protein